MGFLPSDVAVAIAIEMRRVLQDGGDEQGDCVGLHGGL